MAVCGYFTHSISSYRCICTTIKCLNCSYNLRIRTTHILLNMIQESKTFNLIRVLKSIFLWHLLYPHFRKILTKRIANNFFHIILYNGQVVHSKFGMHQQCEKLCLYTTCYTGMVVCIIPPKQDLSYYFICHIQCCVFVFPYENTFGYLYNLVR
jgi:hypothetical protein